MVIRQTTGGLQVPADPHSMFIQTLDTAFTPPPIAQPHRETVGIAEIFRILNRGKWIILASVTACVAFSWIYTMRLPRLYTATTRIDIDLQRRNGIKVDSETGQDNTTVKMDTQLGILRSQSVAWDVIKRLKLHEDKRFMGSTPYPPATNADQLPTTMHLVLMSRFLKGLTVQYERGTEIADIKYSSTDPILASEISNAIADSYEDRNFQIRYSTTSKASTWLKGQLESLSQSMLDAQKQFADFQKQNGLLLTEAHNPNSDKLSALNTALASAQVQRIVKETLYRASESSDPDQVANAGTFPALTALRTQKGNLDAQYASLSPKYGDSYPRVLQLKREIDQVQSAINAEAARARRQLEVEFLAAKQNEEGLVQAVEQQKQKIFSINESSLRYSMLERQVTSSRDLYDDLMKKLQEAGITSGLSADSIAVIDRALPPYVPSFPLRTANLEIGFLIGLILGAALAVLFEIINSSIRTIEDIRLYSGLPSLGLIPHAELLRSAEASDSVESYGRSRRRITDEPRSHFAEAYRNLRSSLLLSSAGEPPQVIVVSSAWPKEGKSTTAINLATVLAQSGKHVLLIDADLKRPSLQRSFENGGLPSSGLSEMLSGSEENAHSIHTDTDIPSLDILFSGRVPPSSSELLMSAQMGKLLDKWRIGYDFIVFDTAPLLAVSDAYYLVSTADAVVLVVRAGSTRRKALRALRDAVLGVRGKIAGVLLNDVKSSSDAYYDYYGGRKENYDIYYSSEK